MKKNCQHSPPSLSINPGGRRHAFVQKMPKTVHWSMCSSHNAMKVNNIVTSNLTTVIKILYQCQTLVVAEIFKQLHWIISCASPGPNEGLRAIISPCINYLDVSSAGSTSAAQLMMLQPLFCPKLLLVMFLVVN